MLTRQVLERFGAGEGNRTLVISLEVPCGCCDFKAHSDKSTVFGTIEPQRLIRFVRIKKLCGHRPAAAVGGPRPSTNAARLSRREVIGVPAQRVIEGTHRHDRRIQAPQSPYWLSAHRAGDCEGLRRIASG